MAQDAGGPGNAANTPTDQQTQTVFPHSDTARWWLSGQVNTILFNACSYTGTRRYFFPGNWIDWNGLEAQAARTASRVLIQPDGYRLTL